MAVRRPKLRDRDRVFPEAASRALSRDRRASFMITLETVRCRHRELATTLFSLE
jgi:hypothetical protein